MWHVEDLHHYMLNLQSNRDAKTKVFHVCSFKNFTEECFKISNFTWDNVCFQHQDIPEYRKTTTFPEYRNVLGLKNSYSFNMAVITKM